MKPLVFDLKRLNLQAIYIYIYIVFLFHVSGLGRSIQGLAAQSGFLQ